MPLQEHGGEIVLDESVLVRRVVITGVVLGLIGLIILIVLG